MCIHDLLFNLLCLHFQDIRCDCNLIKAVTGRWSFVCRCYCAFLLWKHLKENFVVLNYLWKRRPRLSDKHEKIQFLVMCFWTWMQFARLWSILFKIYHKLSAPAIAVFYRLLLFVFGNLCTPTLLPSNQLGTDISCPERLP